MMQQPTTISERGPETAKKIRKALKLVFPGFSGFSVTSDFDSVSVRWEDGPLVPDVTMVLNRFESYTRVLWKTDYYDATGYEWEGRMYVGARYLSTSRSLSAERRAAIIEFMAEHEFDYSATVSERVEWERHMIALGFLQGVAPSHCPDLMREKAPVLDRREPKPVQKAVPESIPAMKPAASDNVIPLFSKDTAALRVERWYEALPPEQKLKLVVLERFMSRADVWELASGSGLTVDAIFSHMANEVFG